MKKNTSKLFWILGIVIIVIIICIFSYFWYSKSTYESLSYCKRIFRETGSCPTGNCTNCCGSSGLSGVNECLLDCCEQPNCDDNNTYTRDYFNETIKQCVNEKILFSKILKPVSALCGTKGRQTIPTNNWINTTLNCSGELLEKDSDFYTISGRNIKLNSIPAIELKFDLNDTEFKEIVELKTQIDMICKFSLSIYTLTEFNEWKPIPDFYFHCQEWTKDRIVAEIEPQIVNNTTYVLITPGTGDSEADVDYAVLNVSFYKI
ncbi:MAG: hypothetical protein OEV44_15240 [Spirochaetota bacterium]|nr:hypothetical protein [Spirochaetota bacterium]